MLVPATPGSLIREFQNEIENIANFDELKSFFNENFVNNTRTGLKFFFCFSKYDIENWQNISNRKTFRIASSKISNDIYSLIVVNTEKEVASISLVVRIKKNFYMFLSDEILKNSLSVTLLKWIEYSYPYLYRVHLDNKGIIEMIDRLKEIYGEIYVTEVQSVIYDPLKNKSQYSSVQLRGKSADKNYSEFRKGIENELYGKVINRIIIDCSGKGGETIMRFRYKRKDKSFTLYSGALDYFWADVLRNCIETFAKTNKSYLNRERRYNNQKKQIELSPIVLKFKNDLNESQLERLTFVLEKMKFLSYTINQSSNPYFSANVVDFKDYSTFSINALNNKIAIVPQTRCSPSSLSDIVEEIQMAIGVAEISLLDE
ncbi:MAG: hypothetical protein HXS52_11890 [Theionarchaea archaeon]|nr:hypothetical protein [Theionarchaea archaeon]